MNQKIRKYAQDKEMKLWQIADNLGLQDSNFSRKLRHEISKQEIDSIITITNEFSINIKKEGDNYE